MTSESGDHPWDALRRALEGDNHSSRAKVWRVVRENRDLFIPQYNVSLETQRELAFRRLERICLSGCLSVFDFGNNPRRIMSMHDALATVDSGTVIKLTVQFNLFGGTVYFLGSSRPQHEKILRGVDSLDIVGCFALTELGYGNNAICMETECTYDAHRDEFVLQSPTPLSQKYWITNGAVHATWAVVFAQLIISGQRKGVHAFLIPIRSENEYRKERNGGLFSRVNKCPGVVLEDMGHRIGCNGVDNAKLMLRNVRIPRCNMLDTTSIISRDGKFFSIVDDSPSSTLSTRQRARQRFLVQTDQLLAGRVCIACMMFGALRILLTNTIRYSNTRLSSGPSGKSDTPIAFFSVQKQTLVPLLTRALVNMTWTNEVKALYERYSFIANILRRQRILFLRCLAGEIDETRRKQMLKPTAMKELHGAYLQSQFEVMIHCCSLKPTMSWTLERAASLCRERSGGSGFLSANQFGELLAAAHAGLTAEGDNRVLFAKVSRELYLNSLKEDAPSWVLAFRNPTSSASQSSTKQLDPPLFSSVIEIPVSRSVDERIDPSSYCFPPRLSTSAEGVGWYPTAHYRFSIPQLELLHRILRIRLSKKFDAFTSLLMRKGVEHRQDQRPTNESSESKRLRHMSRVFDIWMADVDTHDFIYSSQPASIAKAFSDVAAFEAFTRLLVHMESKVSRSFAKTLEPILLIFAAECVEDDSIFCISEELVTPLEVQQLHLTKNANVEKVFEMRNNLVDSLGIPRELLFAPIARDWVEFNNMDHPTEGECIRCPQY